MKCQQLLITGEHTCDNTSDNAFDQSYTTKITANK